MNIRKRTLATLERGYSIAVLPGATGNGLPAFLAGSEGEGELLFFEPPEFRPRVIARAPGGFISIWPLMHKGRRYVVASTLFKPGFNAARSALRLYSLDDGECPPSTWLTDLPYAHRITVLVRGERSFVLASTLCKGKAAADDWSQPGGIHLAEVPADLNAPWSWRQIVSGMNKNHGMDYALLGRERRAGYLLSALEGLFFLPIPNALEGAWPVERLDDRECSDAFAFDWNGDGEPEVFSISPFHGHVLSMHQKQAGAWRRTVIHDDLSFGHIVWAGNFLGRPGLLAGSRRAGRELRLYRPDAAGGVDRNYELIDADIGPSQLAVLPRGQAGAALYVAAHGQNEVRLYEIES
jgi:hypothetical protein